MMNESTIKYSPSQEKHSNYAEMTVCKCPSKPLELNVLNKEVKACRKIDSDYTISKIQELINDCYTCNNHNRISSLLYDFLYATEGKGYVSLSAIINICIYLYIYQYIRINILIALSQHVFSHKLIYNVILEMFYNFEFLNFILIVHEASNRNYGYTGIFVL